MRAVGERERLVFVVEGHRGEHRAEHFLAREPVRRGHVAQQRRRLVEAAFRRVGDHFALRRHRDAVVLRVGEEVPHALLLLRADQRPAVEVEHAAGRRAARRKRLGQPRRAAARRSARSISTRLPAEQVWPAFCTIAVTSTGSAASRSASAKTICGDLPPSSSVTGHVVVGGHLARPAAPVAGEPVNEMWSMPGCRASAAPASWP